MSSWSATDSDANPKNKFQNKLIQLKQEVNHNISAIVYCKFNNIEMMKQIVFPVIPRQDYIIMIDGINFKLNKIEIDLDYLPKHVFVYMESKRVKKDIIDVLLNKGWKKV